jgi:hypothetical protein
MILKGHVYMDGVTVGTVCKQNGKWYVLDNVDFGHRRPFNKISQLMEAVSEWWRK